MSRTEASKSSTWTYNVCYQEILLCQGYCEGELVKCIHSMITCMSIRCRNSYFFRIHEKGGNLQKQYASIYLRPQSEHGYLLFILVSSCKQHCELIYEIVKPVLLLNEKCELHSPISHSTCIITVYGTHTRIQPGSGELHILEGKLHWQVLPLYSDRP